MLEFLSKEKTFRIEPVHREGNGLTFLTEDAPPTERSLKVVDGEGNVAVLYVANARRTGMGVWLGFATIEGGHVVVKTEWPEPVRNHPRLELGLRVRSEQLPGFSALTHDLSTRGIQVFAEQPLTLGSVLTLTLDLDDDYGPLHLDATVRWTKLSPPCRSGLQFTEMAPQAAQRLAQFLAVRSQPDTVIPRLSDSLSELSHESAIQTHAAIVDAYRDDQFVVLRLRNDHETLEFKFPTPFVSVSEVGEEDIATIVTQPTEPNKSRYRFYDSDQKLVLQLESGPPEVTVSGNS